MVVRSNRDIWGLDIPGCMSQSSWWEDISMWWFHIRKIFQEVGRQKLESIANKSLSGYLADPQTGLRCLQRPKETFLKAIDPKQ